MGRPAAPIGAIKIFSRDGHQFRAIKVLDDQQRPMWRPYSKHLYEVHHGPIEPGKRVLHADGDSLNDDPANLVLGTAADALFVALEKPDVEARRVKRLGKVNAQRNREVAALNRAFRILRSEWYLVIHPKRFIRVLPAATRRDLLELFDLPATPNSVRQLLDLGIVPTLGKKIPAEGYARVGDEEFRSTLRSMISGASATN